MSTIQAPATLTDVRQAIQQNRAKHAERLQLHTKHSGTLREIEGRAADLKAKLALNDDHKIDQQLDELDREATTTRRRIDGLTPELQQLDAEHQGLCNSEQELMRAEDLRRMDQTVAEYQKGLQQHFEEEVRAWLNGCRAAYNFGILKAEAVADRTIDEQHRRNLLVFLEGIRQQFVEIKATMVNDKWPVSHGIMGHPSIVPTLPPEETNSTENARAKLTEQLAS